MVSTKQHIISFILTLDYQLDLVKEVAIWLQTDLRKQLFYKLAILY